MGSYPLAALDHFLLADAKQCFETIGQYTVPDRAVLWIQKQIVKQATPLASDFVVPANDNAAGTGVSTETSHI